MDAGTGQAVVQPQPWLVGCNFIPSTAINQLEMWQAGSFDVETIRRELGWAAGLGFNSMRVYLHDLAWQADPAGFKGRIARYLEIAAQLEIGTVFVLFDDCWNSGPRLGPQPSPRPGLHNSGWVQSPGIEVVRNPSRWHRLEAYVQDIVGTYGSDERVVLWDIYNEPGNYFLTSFWLPRARRMLNMARLALGHLLLPVPSLPLLKAAFGWARATQPSQPLTVGLWFLTASMHSRLNKEILGLSDVISFHDYYDLQNTRRLIAQLRVFERPLLCTEYMARTHGNLFATHLPLFHQERVGCFNWGLVSGKTQTIFTWETSGQTTEPGVWYHDILRQDGSAYDPAEVEIIRRLTGYQATTPIGPPDAQT
jgi:hypothetical protein